VPHRGRIRHDFIVDEFSSAEFLIRNVDKMSTVIKIITIYYDTPSSSLFSCFAGIIPYSRSVRQKRNIAVRLPDCCPHCRGGSIRKPRFRGGRNHCTGASIIIILICITITSYGVPRRTMEVAVSCLDTTTSITVVTLFPAITSAALSTIYYVTQCIYRYTDDNRRSI